MKILGGTDGDLGVQSGYGAYQISHEALDYISFAV